MLSTEPKPIYFIAEAGVNHNGDKKLAHALIDAAAEAGADAVKFQTFNAKKLATQAVSKAIYQKNSQSPDETQQQMLLKLELPYAWHKELQAHAHDKHITFLSTAFDLDSLLFLKTLNLPFYKIPSGELTNLPLLWHFAKTFKPLILSTGMATLSEIEQALAIITYALTMPQEPPSIKAVWQCFSEPSARQRLKKHVTLLHCTSQYPTPWDEVNLKAMDTLRHTFGLEVGYSDHTEGSTIPIAAAARGAVVIEKHFTLDKTLEGPDHKASMEPKELKTLIQSLFHLKRALGDGFKAPQPSEWDTRRVARQSIVAAKKILEGAEIKREDLTTARAEEGLAPAMLWDMIGQKSKKTYEESEIF